MFDAKPDENGLLELNVKTGENEKFLEIKVRAVEGDYTLCYYYGTNDKISDVKTCLVEKFGWSKDAISLYYPSGKSYFGNWEPIDASVAKDRDFVLLCVKFLGGGKRAKKTTMTEGNLKELKQSVFEASGTVRAMQGVSPIVMETLAKIDAVMQGVGTGDRRQPEAHSHLDGNYAS